MSVRDSKAQKIHSDRIRRANRNRAGLAAKEKPTEKVAEHFRRKPYGKSTQPNEENETKGL